LSLRKSSRQRRHNVNVISNAADVHEFGAKIAADCCQIRILGTPVGIFSGYRNVNFGALEKWT